MPVQGRRTPLGFILLLLIVSIPSLSPNEEERPSFKMVLRSHFGGGGMESWNVEAMEELGAHWRRATVDIWEGEKPGYFKKLSEEPEEPMGGCFNLTYLDEIIRESQEHGVAIYCIVNAVPNQDGEWPSPEFLAEQFKRIVERYDGDGVDDMPGLEYPIKYWELCNEYEPDLGPWRGLSLETYAEYLKACYKALKEADPEGRLGLGAVVGPPGGKLWGLVEMGADRYFDFISYHFYEEYLRVDEFLEVLEELGLEDKPIWLTESQFGGMLEAYGTQEEVARWLAVSYLYALGRGFSVIMPSELQALPHQPEGLRWSCLIDEKGVKRPSFYAYKTLISKIDYFTDVEVLSLGRIDVKGPGMSHTEGLFAFKFIVDGRPVYALWGEGEPPSEIKGLVKVTTMLGEESIMDISEVEVGPDPIYIEPLSVDEIEAGFTVGVDVLNHTLIYPLERSCKFTIPVSNVGATPLTIHPEIRGVPEDWISVGGGDLRLMPGEEGYIIYAFTIFPNTKTQRASVEVFLKALEMEQGTATVILEVGFKELHPKLEAEIVGRILDEDGNPIAGAEVTAYYWSGLDIVRIASGPDGGFHLRVPSIETLEELWERYSLRGDPRIYLQVSAEGYEAAYSEIELHRDETLELEFRLRPIGVEASYEVDWSMEAEGYGVWLCVPTPDWSLIAVCQGEHGFPGITKQPEKTHIYLIDEEGNLLWSREIESESWAVDVAPDGKVAAGSHAGRLYMWNREGELLWSVALPIEEPIREVRFSHDGRYLAYGPTEEGRGCVALCDAETGKRLWSYQTGDHVRRIAFTEDNEYIVVSSTDGYTYLLTMDGRLLWRRYHGGYLPFILEVSHENDIIVVGGKGQELYAYDFKGNLLWRLEMPEVIQYGDATPDLSRIIVFSGGVLYLIDRDGEILWRRLISPIGHNAIAITPDGKHILLGCMDALRLLDAGGNEIWSFKDFRRGKPPYSEHPFLCAAQTVQISPDASTLLAGFGETDRRVMMFRGGVKPIEAEKSVAETRPKPPIPLFIALSIIAIAILTAWRLLPRLRGGKGFKAVS